ncbi:MAG: magnesium and cobalt transport protein CorA [Candidatus Nephthysia bennettiae]|nr:MAG: magnesium and cobalt transport protein CorA [Candidatus Dormibacteraeota bacterium]
MQREVERIGGETPCFSRRGAPVIRELLHSDGTVTMVPDATDQRNAAPGDGKPADTPMAHCTRIEPHQISEIIGASSEKDILWLDIEQPTEDDLTLLREEFHLHLLAIEDIRTRNQRPKVDDYGTFVHVVIYAAERAQPTGMAVEEIDLFYNDHFLIAVHAAPIPALEEAVDRWRRNTEIIENGIGALIYAVLDTVVDSYFPVLDGIEDEIERSEERIFAQRRNAGYHNETVEGLFALRRELLLLRRVIAPARDVMGTLARRALAHTHADVLPYMQDVYDHVVRTLDTVDTYRDLLTGAMDASLSVTSNRLNQVMKTMTAGSIILMADALIAGIYGMNFKDIPELSWQYGYFYALALMAGVTAILAYCFRRAWWL